MIRTNDHDGVRTTKEDRPTCARWICALPRISTSTVNFVDAPPLKHFWRTLLERAASFAGVFSAITASFRLPGCNFSWFYQVLGRRGSSSLSHKYLNIKDKRYLCFEKENGIDRLGQNVRSRYSRIKAGSPFASRLESFLHPTYIMSHFHGRCTAIIRTLLASHGTARPWNPVSETIRSSIVDYRSSVEKKTLFLKTVKGIRNEGGSNYRTSLSITFSMAFTALLI